VNVEAFLLCDAATDSQGKLNLLGAFDSLTASAFPTVHPACAVVLRVRFQRIEKGHHKVAIHFIDDDGKFVVPPLEGDIDVAVSPDAHSNAVNLILNLQSLALQHAGEYTIVLAIDGKESATLPLHVTGTPVRSTTDNTI
jgi:hypothetical protein